MRSVLVTGATDGIGKGAAAALLAAGWHVLLHARSAERGRAVLAELGAPGNAELVVADFERLPEVAALGRDLRERIAELDVVVNNAGVGSATARRPTADGFDLTWQVNYLAPVLLTAWFEPLLAASRAHVVNVSSAGHAMGGLHFDDLALTRGTYPKTEAYCQSKLAMIVWTYDLADRLAGDGVRVNALHPGTYIDTKMVRASGNPALTSLADGIDSIVHLVVADPAEIGTGAYFDMRRRTRSSPASYDLQTRARLRDTTREMLAPHLPTAKELP